MKTSLTDLQKQTLENIKSDIECQKDMSIKECSDRNYVSAAFLVSLAKKIGYSGYKEMIFALKNSFISQPNYDEEYISRYIANYSEEMKNRFTEIFNSVKEGYLYGNGVGYSMVAIDYFNRRTSKNGYRTIYTENINELASIADKTIIIAVSSSGETEEVVKILEAGKKMQIPVISFVRNPNSRVAKYSDLCIIIPKIEEEDNNGINSFIGNSIVAFELLSRNALHNR